MTSEADELRSKNQLMYEMLCRVSSQLGDPWSQQWCDKPVCDRLRIEGLREDIDDFLEELWEC